MPMLVRAMIFCIMLVLMPVVSGAVTMFMDMLVSVRVRMFMHVLMLM
ncbi:MAG: hypothetical protein HGA43_00670 [Nitrospirae bacterium]|nr:hypothetical protein [Nitrospirota bacterium]